jgi:hypothetical protein
VDDDARQRRVELFATILLAAAAVATAYSTYLSTWWRGEQAEDSSAATAAHIASTEASVRAGQRTQIDIATFTQWVDAEAAGDTELAEFYRQRAREEFRPAFEAWIATDPRANPDAPNTPFEMPQYRPADIDEATRLNAEANEQSAEAAEAVGRTDDYMLAVVLFATALFFAGIAGKFRSVRRREQLVAIGGLIFVGAAAWIASLLIIDSF